MEANTPSVLREELEVAARFAPPRAGRTGLWQRGPVIRPELRRFEPGDGRARRDRGARDDAHSQLGRCRTCARKDRRRHLRHLRIVPRRDSHRSARGHAGGSLLHHLRRQAALGTAERRKVAELVQRRRRGHQAVNAAAGRRRRVHAPGSWKQPRKPAPRHQRGPRGQRQGPGPAPGNAPGAGGGSR